MLFPKWFVGAWPMVGRRSDCITVLARLQPLCCPCVSGLKCFESVYIGSWWLGSQEALPPCCQPATGVPWLTDSAVMHTGCPTELLTCSEATWRHWVATVCVCVCIEEIDKLMWRMSGQMTGRTVCTVVMWRLMARLGLYRRDAWTPIVAPLINRL